MGRLRVTATPLAPEVSVLPRVLTVTSALGGRGLPGPAAWKPPVAYDPIATYAPGPPADLVTYHGNSYVALAPSTGVAPGTDLAVWALVAAAGAGAADRFFEPPVNPTSGQTVFNLTHQPAVPTLLANVNGQILLNGIDYTVSGSTLTTLPALGYQLGPTDTVQLSYIQVN